MYRNATDFSVLTSYPATLLNLRMVQIVIFLIFMVFDSISAEMIFLPLFQIWYFLLFFMPDCTGWDFQYCAGQKWWKRTSFSPAWVRGKALCLSPLGMMFAVVVNIQFLLRWDNFPLFLVCWTFLSWKDVGFRQIISLHQLRRSCVCVCVFLIRTRYLTPIYCVFNSRCSVVSSKFSVSSSTFRPVVSRCRRWHPRLP